MNIKEGMNLEQINEVMRKDRLTIKEVLTTSEGAALFVASLDQKMMDAYKAHPSSWQSIADEIISDGNDIRLPELIGVKAFYVPEGGEIPFADTDITGSTYQMQSFKTRLGISQEMIEDNKVNLMGWMVSKCGEKMKEIEDIEVYKCLDTFNATGRAVNTYNTFVGEENRGVFYTTSTFTNSLSGSALNWEDIIMTSMTTLQTQTRTINGRTYDYPIYADTVLCSPSREMLVRKVLNASIVNIATGAAGGTNVAGTNIFNGALRIVSTPRIATRLAYITQAKRGLVLFRHQLYRQPRIEKTANFAFDCQEVKAVTRFLPAVIDQRAFMPIYT
jgi:hypothetical protein